MKNCRKVGIKVHGDFIIGLPGETKETINKTIDFAKELDCETIQVSLAHAMPGTELHDQMSKEGFLRVEALADQGGHQLPHIEFPHLSKADMMAGVHAVLRRILFPPQGRLAHREGSAVGQPRAQAALSRGHGLPEAARGTPEVGATGRRRTEDDGGGGAELRPPAATTNSLE